MSGVPERMAGLSREQRRELLARLLERNTAKGGSYPLSFAQERLWFLDQLQPGSPAYNIPAPIRIPGPCNVAALERALNEIVRRHEALRTTFAAVEGRPVQVVAAALKVDVPVIDLEHLQAQEQEAESARLAAEDAQRAFDLATGPLLRASLVRLGPSDHVLLLTMHHIVSDEWSMGVFFRELAALYQAYASGRPSPLPELPIQYADFAQWQREWLQGAVLEAHLSYWSQQLAGAPAVLELPADRPRPPVQSFAGAQRSFLLPNALSEALAALSQREGVTLFMTLLAAFKTLLYRYTGQHDVVVGSPIANRTRAEVEDLIGFFVNTLVLRSDLSGNPTFRHLLQRVRDVTLDAYAHQDLPFEKLVEELQPERNLSHNPLVQVLFVLQNTPTSMVGAAGAAEAAGGPQVGTGTAKSDLILFIVDSPQGLAAAFEYNTDLFETARIERMIGHFQTLLYGIAESPDKRLSELPLLSSQERQQLLVEWNDTAADYPRDRCLHQLFEDQVRRTPDAVAAVFEDQNLTYRQLDAQANYLAHALVARGVGPEVRVGIAMERSLEMVVGLLGILKAGGAYVPLDPSYPSDRLAFMMHDAQVPVLLTQERLLTALPPTEADVLCVDRDLDVMGHESTDGPLTGVTPDNLAYVIYTSGSTGRPKGVAMGHRALANLISWQIRRFDSGNEPCTLQFASLSFDVSFQEIFSTWCSGGALTIISDDTRRDFEATVKLVARAEVNTLFLSPTALSQFAAAAIQSSYGYLLRCLRHILVAGEAMYLTPELVDIVGNLPESTLRNQYGPCESHVVTEFVVDVPWQYPRSFPPIGRPIANTQVYVLDQHLEPVPIGVPGELHIAGAGLARGYLSRPEITAEKFIPNPFSEDPGSRLYRTGDVARYLPDGNIEFLGRMDHQVKLRGFRIELGEIEAVLGQHPVVGESVVVAREEAQDKRLVAYVVAHPGAAVSVSELRGFLRERLPEYMLPAAFVILDALPLSPNGKVDRRALPAPDTDRPALEEAYVAPRSPIEEVLAGIWAEVLGLERVGVHDNFFELGGHSLLATQVVSRVRESLQVEVPLRRMFETPTIASLAVAIVQAQFEHAPGPKTEQLLEDLERLSQDEVRHLLGERN